jgi:hypothetical protein
MASNTCLRLTTQVGQDHAATGVLLALGTNNQLHGPESAAETFGCLHITHEVRGWQQPLGTLVHLLSYFLRISIGLA